MKGGVEHRVPLSDARGRARTSAPFTRRPGAVVPLPNQARQAVIGHDTNENFARQRTLRSRHRSRFQKLLSRLAADTGKLRETAEAALAHTVGGVEGAYFRSDLFERRRRLMDDWGLFVTGATGTEVVQLRE